MSEQKPEADKAGDKASSPSRRRALKAALASAPIIMSIKSRPAFAVQDPGGTNQIDVQQNSNSLSSNLSARPTARR